MMSKLFSDRAADCPPWCSVRHARRRDEDDATHVSGALMVRGTLLRLCMTQRPGTDGPDGPYVLMGQERYTLHEADALIDALTQLVDRASSLSSPAAP